MIKRGKFFLLIIALFFFINFISAESINNSLHLNIQTTNESGSVVTGTFKFEFNITSDSGCANVLYNNFTNLTTDSRGIISYYLENVNLNFSDQYWLCYYRDGSLVNSSMIVRSPYTFRAKNVSAEGIINDSNLDLTGQNITSNGIIIDNVMNKTSANITFWSNFFPLWDNLLDLGSTSFRWKDLFLGGQVYSNGTGDNYFLGNVGIGTSNPSAELEVSGDVSATGKYYGDGSALTGVIASSTSWNRSVTNVILASTGDYVGIGTTNPLTKFHLNGTMTLSDGGGKNGTFKILPNGEFEINNDIGLAVKVTGGAESLYQNYLYSDTLAGMPIFSLLKSNTNNLNELNQTRDGEYLGAIFFSGISNVPANNFGAIISAVQNGDSGAYVPARLIMRTYNSTGENFNQLVLDSTGNVGIGTYAPSEKLEVVGAIKIGTTTSSSAGVIRFADPNFQGYNGTDWENLGTGSVSSGGWTDDGVIVRLTTSSDSVGIGTSTPSQKLEVAGGNLNVSAGNLSVSGAITSNMTKISAYKSDGAGSQSINDITLTKITFDTENFDTLGEFSNSLFNCTQAGYYEVYAQVRGQELGSLHRWVLFIYKNGANVAQNYYISPGAGGSSDSLVIKKMFYLNVNDYIEIKVYQENGNARVILSGDEDTYVEIRRVG